MTQVKMIPLEQLNLLNAGGDASETRSIGSVSGVAVLVSALLPCFWVPNQRVKLMLLPP